MRQQLRTILISVTSFNLLLLSACSDPSYIEIYTPQTSPSAFDRVLIEGNVELPGIYPLKPGDTIEALLEAAGGINGDSTFRLVVGDLPTAPQKVNLNTAEAWLLTALPGVGEAKANAIIEYRTANGSFVNILELTKVPGFGPTLFESLKDLISVTA